MVDDFITGDIHGKISIRKLAVKNWPVGKTLTKQNNLFITGDFGLVWDGRREDTWWIKWLSDKPWTTLFVPGNHENYDILETLPEIDMFGSKVLCVGPTVFMLKRGEIYEINGKRMLAFGGGMSHDIEYRVEGKSWWPQEVPSQSEFDQCLKNLDRYNWTVDYIISHVPPSHEVLSFMPSVFRSPTYALDRTEHMLGEIQLRTSFIHWYFGHIHTDQTIGRFTSLFNCIIKVGENIWRRRVDQEDIEEDFDEGDWP